MRELHLWKLDEGSITGDPGRCVNQGSGDGPLFHRDPAGEPGMRLVHWGLREMNGVLQWGISLQGISMRGTWREGSFTGDTEGYAK